MGDYNRNFITDEQAQKIADFLRRDPPKQPEPEVIVEASAWCHSLEEARIVRNCLSIMLPSCEVICYEDIYMLSYRIVAYTVKS